MSIVTITLTWSGLPPNVTDSSVAHSDVNKDCKDKDKDQAYKDKDFTYSYLLQVATKPTIAIMEQQWTQSENSQHMTVKPITLNK